MTAGGCCNQLQTVSDAKLTAESVADGNKRLESVIKTQKSAKSASRGVDTIPFPGEGAIRQPYGLSHRVAPQKNKNGPGLLRQEDAQVAWSRIIYSDASSIDLDGMMGLDSHGNAGLR